MDAATLADKAQSRRDGIVARFKRVFHDWRQHENRIGGELMNPIFEISGLDGDLRKLAIQLGHPLTTIDQVMLEQSMRNQRRIIALLVEITTGQPAEGVIDETPVPG